MYPLKYQAVNMLKIPPPKNPSKVLFGLIPISFVRPIVRPTKKAAMSLNPMHY